MDELLEKLKRENTLLREENHQAKRVHRMWQEALLKLKETQKELLAVKSDLESSNRELTKKTEDLEEANREISRLAYSDKKVIESIKEGVLVSDEENRIVDVNPAFQVTTGYSREEVLGENPRILKSEKQNKAFYEAMWEEILKKGQWQGEIWNKRKNGEVYPEFLSIACIRKGNGAIYAYTGIFIDISERKKAEEEREELIVKLKKSIEEVKALSGLLPICSSCKKIRDDQGYWNQLETYIRDHSEVEFTHSFCPDCVKKLCPE